MESGSPVISGCVGWWNAASLGIDTLPWSGVPGVELSSDVVTMPSVPCTTLGMDSRYGIIRFWGGCWWGVY